MAQELHSNDLLSQASRQAPHEGAAAAQVQAEPARVDQVPPDEEARLAELYEYRILDTPPERVFDEIARMAAATCGVPCAAIALVDRERVWFKARQGIVLSEVERHRSLCGQALLERGLFEVPDLQRDRRFASSPLYTDASRPIRYYASAPILSEKGRKLGALCVMDVRAGQLSPGQWQALEQLAHMVAALFDAHWQRQQQEWARGLIDGMDEAVTLVDARSARYVYGNRAALRQLGCTLEELKQSTPMDMMPSLSSEQFLCNLDRLRAGAPQIVDEGICRRRNGWLYPVQVRLQLLGTSAAPLVAAVTQDLSERQADKARGATGEARIARLLRNSAEGYFRATPDLRIVEVDSAICRMTGFAREELVGQPLSTLFLCCPMDGALEADDRSGRTDFYREDVRVQHRDGTPLDVRMSATIERDEQGAPLCVTALLQRGDAQRQGRQQVRALSVESRRGLEACSGLLCSVDPQGRFIGISLAACHLLGFGEQELLGHHWTEFMHPEDRARGHAALQELLETGALPGFESRWRRKGGETLYFCWAGTWRADVGGAYITVRDASAQHHAQERLETLLARTGDVFLALAPDATLTCFNPALLRWTAVPEPLLLGRQLFREVCPQLQGTEFEQTLRDVMLTRQPAKIEGFCEPYKAWLSVRAYPLSDGGMAVLFNDVTPRKTLEKMKDHFVTGVNHKLRNGLTPVHGAIKLLELGTCGKLPEPVENMVKLASRSVDRLRCLVDDVLNASEKQGAALDGPEFLVAAGSMMRDRPCPLACSVSPTPGEEGLACGPESETCDWAGLEALRQSEARYRALAELNPDATIVLVDCCVAYANAAAARLLGAREACDLVGRSVLDLVEPECHPAVRERTRLLRENPGKLPPQDYRIRRLDGAVLDVESVAGSTRWQGRPAAHVILRDISACKRREAHQAFLADVTEESRRLSSADDIMQAAGAKIGAHFRISACSFADVDESRGELTVRYAWHEAGVPSLVRTYPFEAYMTEEFLRASRCGEMLVVRDTQKDMRVDSGACAAIEVGAFIAVPFHTKGQWTNLLAVTDSRPRHWRDDEIELFRELANRIFPRIERVRAQAALRESEASFRAIANLVPDQLWSNNSEGGADWVNQRWIEYTGQSGEEWRGGGWGAAIHPEDLPNTLACWQESLQHARTLKLEHRVRRHDGQYRWHLVHAEPMRDEEGRVIRWFGTAVDIHEQRMAHDSMEQRVKERTRELEEAARLRRELLAHMECLQDKERREVARELHDSLGQFLTGLSLSIAVLQRQVSDASIREQLGLMQRQLISIDLELDRIIFMLRPAFIEDCGLGQGLASYVADWAALTGVPVDLELRGLDADAERLPPRVEEGVFRVVQEALTNVAKHAKAKTVNVCVKHSRGQLVASIEDDGAGFDPAGSSPTNLPRRSWGLLGMKERVEVLGGTLEVESCKGAGTAVLLKVPLPSRDSPNL